MFPLLLVLMNDNPTLFILLQQHQKHLQNQRETLTYGLTNDIYL